MDVEYKPFRRARGLIVGSAQFVPDILYRYGLNAQAARDGTETIGRIDF